MNIQPDIIEKIGNSKIQHGKYNDRIYQMNVALEDAVSLPDTLKSKASECEYSKIFAKVPASLARPFMDHGFIVEAKVPRFYDNREAALMLGLFLADWRRESKTADRNEQVMEACRQKQAIAAAVERPNGVTLRICQPDDADTMAKLYGEVFPTYPFPIDDPDYIRKTMASHVVYFGVWMEGKLVALSSTEMCVQTRHVEMTDFATSPGYRGRGLATTLLSTMETEMLRRDMATAYTIARAPSFGMNITFARMGYSFAGRLINNTNIGGQFEDMNVWYKHLATNEK